MEWHDGLSGGKPGDSRDGPLGLVTERPFCSPLRFPFYEIKDEINATVLLLLKGKGRDGEIPLLNSLDTSKSQAQARLKPEGQHSASSCQLPVRTLVLVESWVGSRQCNPGTLMCDASIPAPPLV